MWEGHLKIQKKIIIKYGELWLKSEPVKNRFLKILDENIRSQLKANEIKNFKLERKRDFLLLSCEEKEMEKAKNVLKNVFGISWFAEALSCENNKEEIEKIVLQLSKNIKPNETFAIKANRSDKSLGFTSKEIENEMGAKIQRKVNLSNPDITIYLELRKEGAFGFTEKIKGCGGLPYGVSGKVLSLISGGIDSPVASWMLMKRGCVVDFIHFYPTIFTKEKNLEVVKKIIGKLREYSPRKLTLYIVNTSEIQKAIVSECERKFTCVLCRRMMYRVSEMLAKRIGAKSLVTGENLAQVASQTLDNLFVENEAIRIPVFRPLIGMDKEEVISLAKKIGTYELSVQVGCCSLAPQRPSTKANIEKILEEEKKIKNLDMLIANAFEKIEKVVI
ncbi:MAG: tRNA uracil 4-sulfurtransferase ThiI [Candidatus Aenigmatarchaeota archaeon]